jgi:hypothetical protein
LHDVLFLEFPQETRKVWCQVLNPLQEFLQTCLLLQQIGCNDPNQRVCLAVSHIVLFDSWEIIPKEEDNYDEVNSEKMFSFF